MVGCGTQHSVLIRGISSQVSGLLVHSTRTATNSLTFSASSDTKARLWNVESGEVELEYCGHQKPVTSLAYRE